MSTTESSHDFGDALRCARQPKTQAEAAICAGLLQNEISKIENGTPPSFRQLKKLVEAYPILIEAVKPHKSGQESPPVYAKIPNSGVSIKLPAGSKAEEWSVCYLGEKCDPSIPHTHHPLVSKETP